MFTDTTLPSMTALLSALFLGVFALPSCANCSETVADGRSYGNRYNGINSYTAKSKNVNSYSSNANKIDANSYGVGSSYIVSPTDYNTDDYYNQPASNTNDYYNQPASNTNDYYNQPASNTNDYYNQPASNTNDYYNQPASNTNDYYSQPGYNSYTVQDRFHPHKSKPDPQIIKVKPELQVFNSKPDDDSHTGEVVLPPASTNQDLVASGSSQEESFAPADPTAQGNVNVEVSAEPSNGEYQNYDYPQPTSPPLPGGYDYNPPPSKPTPYYYYPPPAPSNHYLPVPSPPPPPPNNQYLPVPTPPPPPPPPPIPAPQEERQGDYTYYYLGPKLWYVPLFFSIYFVIYIGALIIKAVSKHKILFPQQLYNAATSVYQSRESRVEELTARVTKGIAQAALRYLTQRNRKN